MSATELPTSLPMTAPRTHVVRGSPTVLLSCTVGHGAGERQSQPHRAALPSYEAIPGLCRLQRMVRRRWLLAGFTLWGRCRRCAAETRPVPPAVEVPRLLDETVIPFLHHHAELAAQPPAGVEREVPVMEGPGTLRAGDPQAPRGATADVSPERTITPQLQL